MSTARKTLHLIGLLLLALGSTALPAQDNADKREKEKQALAEAKRQADSSDVGDRLQSVFAQGYDFVDYELLYQLMSDPDLQVKSFAITQLPVILLLTPFPPPPLPVATAQKITVQIEKELTQERIDAAFAPGPFNEHPAAVVLHSIVTLSYLHQHYYYAGSFDEHVRWQRRVALPVSIAMISRNYPSPAALDELLNSTLGDVLNAVSDPAALTELLGAAMKNLDDPKLPWNRQLETLHALWHHSLLGQKHPLNFMLVAQLSLRLETLKPRFLSGLPQVPSMQYAADMMTEITAAVLAARQNFTPPPASAAGK